MAKIGYARVSSKEQNLDRQLQALQGVSKVFSDKLSGQSVERPQLQAMLNYIREGDIQRTELRSAITSVTGRF